MYKCMNNMNQAQRFEFIYQVFAKNTDYSSLCYHVDVNLDKEFEFIVQNTLNVCENQNICVFPTIMINGIMIEQFEMLGILEKSQSDLKQYLREVILVHAKECIELYKINKIDV